MNAPRKKQSGFTIFESMIAVTISMIFTTGLIHFFVNNKHGYELQENISVLQGTGRYAINKISEGIRIVDHWGGISGKMTNGIGGVINGIGDCDQQWIVDFSSPIVGYEGATDINSVNGFPGNCIPAQEYQTDTDILVLRYGGAIGRIASGDLGNAENSNKIFVRSMVGDNAQLIMGGDGIPDALPDADGAYNFPYVIEVYFIRSCLVKKADVCQDNIPTLVRLALNGNNLVQETLAENVEQLQLEYGSDADSDGVIDRYDDADNVPNWKQVLNTRIGIIVRSESYDEGVVDSYIYELPGYDYQVTGDLQHYTRKKFVKLIQIRNRS